MAKFRITSTPRGQAPEEVRQQWVGIILPMKDAFNPDEGFHERNFNLQRQQERSFVTVPVMVALEELEVKSPLAARWFYENLSEHWLSRDFSFGIDEVEILGDD